MKSNPVGWFEIYVSDMNRARKFYESVFQTKLTALPGGPEIEMYAFPMEMGMPGAGGTLAKMKGFNPGSNSVLVYFSSEDCAVEAKRVTESGGRIQKNKTSIGEYGYIALAYDSEGNMFGIHSRN